MKRFPFDKNISNETELLDYFTDAIRYRSVHKDQSADIASHVYQQTQPYRVAFTVSDKIDDLRFEFIALEAPGMPEDDNKDPDEYEDELWQRLLEHVNSF